MSDADTAIARLEARVDYLEKKLAERSKLLRSLTKEVCDEDLLKMALFAAGLPPLPRPGFGLRGWRETATLVSADVERTMHELWRSVTPPDFGDGE